MLRAMVRKLCSYLASRRRRHSHACHLPPTTFCPAHALSPETRTLHPIITHGREASASFSFVLLSRTFVHGLAVLVVSSEALTYYR